jgi:hypothetical protein
MAEENMTVRNKNFFKELTLTLIFASAMGMVAIGLMWLLSGFLISLI